MLYISVSSGCWKYGDRCRGPSVKEKDHLAGLVKETSAVYNIQTEQTLYCTFSALRFWDILGCPYSFGLLLGLVMETSARCTTYKRNRHLSIQLKIHRDGCIQMGKYTNKTAEGLCLNWRTAHSGSLSFSPCCCSCKSGEKAPFEEEPFEEALFEEQ